MCYSEFLAHVTSAVITIYVAYVFALLGRSSLSSLLPLVLSCQSLKQFSCVITLFEDKFSCVSGCMGFMHTTILLYSLVS